MTNGDPKGPPRRQDEGCGNSPSDNAGPNERQRKVDPLAAWLLRAAARYHLLKSGEIATPGEVFDDNFIADFMDATGCCRCRNAINYDHWRRLACEERLRLRSLNGEAPMIARDRIVE